MRRLYQLKLKRLNNYKKRLDELEKDFLKNSDAISAATDPVTRERLQKQESILEKEMEQLAKQYDALEEELQKLPEYQELQKKEKALEDIITLLTLLNDISLDKVINAYRFCLPEANPNKSSETHESLIQKLAEMPEAKGELKPVLRFVNFLIHKSSLTYAQREELKAWAKAHGLPAEMLNSEQKQNQANTVETCLMVKVKPRSLNDSSKGYLLNATLFTDSDPFEPEAPEEPIVTPIEVPPPNNPNSLAYSQDELGIVLGKLIDICGAKHEIALTELTVQLFLPIELMSLAIEHSQLSRGKQCCGQRCKALLVRSYERHFLEDYRSAKGDWKKYWKRFLEFPEATCADTLTLLTVAKKTKIQANKPKVLGCRFIEHHEQQQQEDFWDNILAQGLPIAFWIRHLGTTPQEAKRVMGSVTRKCPIAKLPESLRKKRQQILSQQYESESEQFKKAPLCLLWDNPFRPFPSINYQSE